MKSNQNKPILWSHHEWDLINVTEIFKHKPAILKKVESCLEELRSALAVELKVHPKPYPPDTDLVKGQIARGENHKGFPFLSLDIPQKFSKTEFFTFRTLFWWGHYLGFALILKSPSLDSYSNRLIKCRQDTSATNVYISQHTSPWEWELSEENFKKVSELSKNETQTIVDRLQYIKLMRFYPLQEKSFPELNWTEEGIQSYRDLIHLVLE
jgi:hypothetical protein